MKTLYSFFCMGSTNTTKKLPSYGIPSPCHVILLQVLLRTQMWCWHLDTSFLLDRLETQSPLIKGNIVSFRCVFNKECVWWHECFYSASKLNCVTICIWTTMFVQLLFFISICRYMAMLLYLKYFLFEVYVNHLSLSQYSLLIICFDSYNGRCLLHLYFFVCEPLC